MAREKLRAAAAERSLLVEAVAVAIASEVEVTKASMNTTGKVATNTALISTMRTQRKRRVQVIQ